jgi:hypothetical protein
MNTVVWIAQALLAVAMLGAGAMKLTQSKAQLMASGNMDRGLPRAADQGHRHPRSPRRDRADPAPRCSTSRPCSLASAPAVSSC